MKKATFVFLTFSIFVLVLGLEDKTEAAMSFGVRAIIPENQVDKKKSYFDLRMTPGKTQTIEVELTNTLNRNVIVENNANTAITNDNGVVDYSVTNPKFDKTLAHPFSKIAEVEKEITIPAKNRKKIPIKITMPKEPYDGMILGGLYFTEKISKEQEKKEKQVQVRNRFAYALGVSLTETDKKVTPDLKLGKISPGQDNYRNVLKANLQNPKATIIKDLKIEANVTKKDQKDILFKENKTGLKMAPNSNFNYGINWKNQGFQPGEYTLHMVARSGEKVWKWDKNFEIKDDDADELNKKAVDLEKNYTLWYILGGILLVLLLMLSVYLLTKKSNTKREQELREKIREELEDRSEKNEKK